MQVNRGFRRSCPSHRNACGAASDTSIMSGYEIRLAFFRPHPGEAPEDRRARSRDVAACKWPGCAGAAAHRAPKGRLREGEYWRFCLEHVREYNHSYNYFAGMSDEAVAKFQKDSVTGHRPTWKLGINGKPLGNGKPGAGQFDAGLDGTADPFGVFTDMGSQGSARPDQGREVPHGPQR